MDERLDVGVRRCMGEGCLADVDDAEVEDVVMRYISKMGGADVVGTFGEAWTL